jgi:hypothetical protein
MTGQDIFNHYQKNVLHYEDQLMLTDPINPENRVLKLTLSAMPVPIEWPMSFYT